MIQAIFERRRLKFRLKGRGVEVSLRAVLPMNRLIIVFLLICIGGLSGRANDALPERFQFRTPAGLSCRIEEPVKAARTAAREPVQWLRASLDDGSTNHIELGSRVVLQVQPGTQLTDLTTNGVLKLSRTISADVFILQAPDAWTAAREADRMAALPGVRASYPVMRRQADLHGPYAYQPSDFFFNIQWPLENRTTNDAARAGADLNVRAAWPFTMGEGVAIAVADTGVELNHPELAARATGPHHNFIDRSDNGSPLDRRTLAAHGTHVAGLAVASLDTNRVPGPVASNRNRMVGVAPGAALASWRIYTTNFGLASDEDLMDMYQFRSDVVAVQNHSWGFAGVLQRGFTLLEDIGLSNAVHRERSGRGVVMLRSAGNDRGQGANMNDDAYPSDPRVIGVAAMNRNGRAADYSEPGAAILVAGPSTSSTNAFHLFSTDLLGTDGKNSINFFPPFEDLSGYVFDALGFNGTSAAVPQIAGVAALMLSANTNLSYRDVQQILVLASRHFDFADPDLTANGAGFLVSHNVGFGLPDAGEAVRLARAWPTRPPLTNIVLTATNAQTIPDDGLRVLVTGDNIPPNLRSIRALPGTGPHADTPTAALPLVDVGLATNTISLDLTNKAALIERGTNTFEAKVNFAARAGASFAVVYNFATNASGSGAPGGEQLIPLAGTDYTPIPAVFITHSNGVALRELFRTNSTARAQIHLETTNYAFAVTNSILCEHVSVRVKTDHPLRGDIRMTLVSPSGKRSVLQRYNADESPGPVDWTYHSTHHFFESSVGNWLVYFSDQYEGNTGAVQQVTLTIRGTAIVDVDRDGLDDAWERDHLNNLSAGAVADPDLDGYSNMREQLMGTNPRVMDVPFEVDLSRWNPSLARLSWPASTNFVYQVSGGTNLTDQTVITNLPGRFPEVEWFTPYSALRHQFFRVQALPAQ
jgi:subtilisin-like proprotein convertase family protein/subtilisin family serine protease